jgi:hypothetical protein
MIFFDVDTKKITNMGDFSLNIDKWINAGDYRSMGHFILNGRHNLNIIDVYSTCLNWFETNGLKLRKNSKI